MSLNYTPSDLYPIPPRPEKWGQGIIIFSSVSLRIIILNTTDIDLLRWIGESGGACIYDDYQKTCLVVVDPGASYYHILSYLENSYDVPHKKGMRRCQTQLSPLG